MAKDKERIKDILYKRYNAETNMSFQELMKWKNNPLSKKASLSRKPINLALLLKKKKKSEWRAKEYRGAMKAIKYLKRAKKIRGKNYIPGTRITYNDVALKNWGYDVRKKKRVVLR